MKFKISLILAISIILFSIKGQSQNLNTDPNHDYSLGYSLGATIATYLASYSNGSYPPNVAATISNLMNTYANNYYTIAVNLDAPNAAQAYSNGFQAGLQKPTIGIDVMIPNSSGGGGTTLLHISSLLIWNVDIANGTLIPGSYPTYAFN